MPWKETDVLKERVKFILEWEKRFDATRGEVNFAELCREFGISRPCGYKWIQRYRKAGDRLDAVRELSRKPHHSPTATPTETEDFVVLARKRFPKWGPKKLHSFLLERYPTREWPSLSAIGIIIKRRGLVRTPRKRRRSVPPAAPPFPEATAPNDVWCVDFKGWFRLGDGEKCHPLTLLDAYSRFLLRCEAVLEPNGERVQSIFDSAFREFGVPKAMRFDGGPPFASNAPGRLSKLSVWWLRLGIQLQQIEPGKPQQNGRLERMHRTLKSEVTIEQDVFAQQRALDHWRRHYNEERPHEALTQTPPCRHYSPSRTKYPRPLLQPQAMSFDLQLAADKHGAVRFKKRKVLISSALAYEKLQLFPIEPGIWEVSFGQIVLGILDEAQPDKGLIQARRQSKKGEVSTMSL
jgi:transposase InsO family protein